MVELEHHIARCKQHIDEQRRRILELERRGEDTAGSARLLATLVHFLATLELRRDTQLRLARLQRETSSKARAVRAYSFGNFLGSPLRLVRKVV